MREGLGTFHTAELRVPKHGLDTILDVLWGGVAKKESSLLSVYLLTRSKLIFCENILDTPNLISSCFAK